MWKDEATVGRTKLPLEERSYGYNNEGIKNAAMVRRMNFCVEERRCGWKNEATVRGMKLRL